MRARLGLASAGITVELREVVLRDKPRAFLDTSPSATVPCLDTGRGVIDESLDIMIWALEQNDPEKWLKMPKEGFDLIGENDGPFKAGLDRYKYPTRYAETDPTTEREKASDFLNRLETHLSPGAWLLGERPCLADMAILPFVRQFAHVDLDWFSAQPWPNVIHWLETFKTSPRFAAIMAKHPQWHPGSTPVMFP